VRVASSGRKHFPLPVSPPLADFAAIAAQYEVYRIEYQPEFGSYFSNSGQSVRRGRLTSKGRSLDQFGRCEDDDVAAGGVRADDPRAPHKVRTDTSEHDNETGILDISSPGAGVGGRLPGKNDTGVRSRSCR
jgi:hypothetical protein